MNNFSNLASGILTTLFLFFTTALAAPVAPQLLDPAAPAPSFHNRVTKVEVIEPEDRRTEKQFADENHMTLSEAQNRYAATGKLICGAYIENANITLKPDLIITTAHLFRKMRSPNPCELVVHSTECTFVTKIGNVTKTVKVQRKVAAGYDGRCPGDPPKYTDDWAILKLKKPIKGIQPYQVLGRPIEVGQTVTSVENNAADFAEKKYDARGNPIPLKSIGKCTVKDVYLNTFSSDCDFTYGNSGGAILIDDPAHPPALIGISIGNYEHHPQLQRAINSHRPNHCQYTEGQCATMHIPVEIFWGAMLGAADSK